MSKRDTEILAFAGCICLGSVLAMFAVFAVVAFIRSMT